MFKLIRNKKSQQIFVSMMISILALIVLVIIVSPLKEEISRATNGTYSSYLNSSNPNLAIEHQATTTIIDLTLFYFVAILIGASLSYISGRKTFTGVVTAIAVFVIINVLINPLKSLIIIARDSTHLDCAAATFTVGQKLSCLFVDLWLFYFTITVIAAAATFIFLKTTSKVT